MNALQSWLKQPTTIAGLAAVGGFLTMLANGTPLTTALPALIAGVIGIVLPDHTAKPPAA